MTKPYRKAFIAMQSGHDFSALAALCEEMKFCAHGYETEDQIEHSIRIALQDFIPELDIIVPVGNVTVSCILGAIASEGGVKFNMAVYRDKEYHIQPIWIGAKNGK